MSTLIHGPCCPPLRGTRRGRPQGPSRSERGTVFRGRVLGVRPVVIVERQTGRSPIMTTLPNIVLVHGAWADGSSWSAVIERLQAAGYHVTAPAVPADHAGRRRRSAAPGPGPPERARRSLPGTPTAARSSPRSAPTRRTSSVWSTSRRSGWTRVNRSARCWSRDRRPRRWRTWTSTAWLRLAPRGRLRQPLRRRR